MVAPVNSGPREPRASEIPAAATEVYGPGDVVQLRLGAGKPEIILWVEQSTWLFSSTLAYFTTNGEQKFRRDPAEVVRISPPAVPPVVTATPVPPAFPGAEAVAGAAPDVVKDESGIVWQTGAFRKVSADGRFEVAVGSSNFFVATDHWTGESTGDLANESSALDWCRIRLNTVHLNWNEGENGCDARDDYGNEWNAYRTALNNSAFRATDSRRGLGSPLAPIRSSPDFGSLDQAKAWCAVRATCVVEAGGTLRYDPVAMIIPF